MTVESPPAFLQAGTYGAEQTRRAIASTLARGASVGSIAGGLIAAGDCQLSAPVSGMTVNVGTGEAWVPGSLASTQSGYYCRVSSQTALAIAAANATNPRIDTVVAVVGDTAYTGSADTFALAVVTGTPTAGATLGNLNGAGSAPANALVLGYVLVPATATNIVSGDILNVATVVQTISLGISSGTLASRPSPGHPPRGYYATDTKQYFFDAASLWITGLGLNSRTISGATTANPGDCVIVTAGAPFTLTIPAPTPGAIIGVVTFSASGTNPITLSTGTGFNGLFVNNPTTMVLGQVGASVMLVANGTTNWVIVAGGQDTGWVPLNLLSTSVAMTFDGYTSVPSAREADGQLQFSGTLKSASGTISAGGVFGQLPTGFYVPLHSVLLSVTLGPETGWGGPAPDQVWLSGGTTQMKLVNAPITTTTGLCLDGLTCPLGI